jgi:hypothetical protein
MSRGVLLYAHNNSEIDYLKIACINSLMVQKNLLVKCTLVTDSSTFDWGKKTLGIKFINQCFENIICVNRDYTFKNNRNYSDTSFSSKSLQFYNCNHWEAYNITPYDETLFIDCDYLIMSSSLANCWNSDNDVMVNHKIYSPIDESVPYSMLIDNMGIKLYWATVIYFRKSTLAENLFSIVKDIQDNYHYYKDLYFFNNGMYRNDNAFSIAIHMLNGFCEVAPVIHELPIPGLCMVWDTDDIYLVNNINDITLYAEKRDRKGEYILSRMKNIDIHIVNKWSIIRHSDRLIELYK